MTKVEIDDFNCPKCKEITYAELDMKTKKYYCYKCGTQFDCSGEETIHEKD